MNFWRIFGCLALNLRDRATTENCSKPDAALSILVVSRDTLKKMVILNQELIFFLLPKSSSTFDVLKTSLNVPPFIPRFLFQIRAKIPH